MVEQDPAIKHLIRRAGDGPYHVRFPYKFTDSRGREHPGEARIFIGQKLVTNRFGGRDACHIARYLNEAFARGVVVGKGDGCEGVKA